MPTFPVTFFLEGTGRTSKNETPQSLFFKDAYAALLTYVTVSREGGPLQSASFFTSSEDQDKETQSAALKLLLQVGVVAKGQAEQVADKLLQDLINRACKEEKGKGTRHHTPALKLALELARMRVANTKNEQKVHDGIQKLMTGLEQIEKKHPPTPEGSFANMCEAIRQLKSELDVAQDINAHLDAHSKQAPSR